MQQLSGLLLPLLVGHDVKIKLWQNFPQVTVVKVLLNSEGRLGIQTLLFAYHAAQLAEHLCIRLWLDARMMELNSHGR